MRRRLTAVAGLALATACAQIGEPPGGPPDRTPPVLLRTDPDSLVALPGFRDDVAFEFDEIVNEGSAPNFGLGNGDLERLIVLSPSENVPVVKWKRSRVTVKPREGWQPNRVYRVELLPGIADLRNNRSRFGRVITFTTGAPLPGRILTGRVVDWTTARPQALALVEAILMPDSLVYRTAADSTGRFAFGPLPDGEMLVAGVIDQNRNGKRDGRELFDTVRVALARDSVGEIWAFRHDTVAARIQSLALTDSVTITATFNQHLNPYQRLAPDSVRVRALPDSTDVPVLAMLPREAFDSIYGRRPARDTAAADSVARPDTAAATPPRPGPPAAPPPAGRQQARDTSDMAPLTSRPMLFDRLLIRVGEPLEAGRSYVVEVRGLLNANGIEGTAFLGLQIPARRAPTDSTAARADSVPPRPAADTTTPRPDTAARLRPRRR